MRQEENQVSTILKANKEKTVQTAEVVDRLKQIREELVKLRKSLDYLT